MTAYKLAGAAFLVLATQCPTAMAESAVGAAESAEIVVLGTRLTAPATPPEVIGVPAVEQRAAGDVLDVFRRAPGVSILDPGGPGGRAELYLRAADPNFLTVLIEGVQVNDVADSRGGGYDFSTIAAEEVGEISVARGPFSALYGSGALGGVVNVNLRSGGTPARPLSGRAMAGGDGAWSMSAGAGGALADGVEGSLLVRAGDDGEALPFSQRRTAAATGKMSVALTPTGGLDVVLRRAMRDREAFEVSSGGPRFAANRQLERADAEDTLARVAFAERRGEDLRFDAQLSYYRREEDVRTPGQPDGVFSGIPAATRESVFERVALTASASRRFGARLDLGGGIELARETGEVEGALDFGGFAAPASFDLARDAIAAFGEARVGLGAGFSVFAGARVDDYSDGDSVSTGRGGLAYENESGLTAEISYGEAQKRPSFYALGDPLVGNADLDPEQSEGVEARLSKTFMDGSARASVAYFRTTYQNLIDFDFATFALVNRGEVEVEGGEVAFEADLSDALSLAANVSVAANEVDGEGQALLHRPEFGAALAATWRPAPAWTVLLREIYVGERPSASIPTGQVELDGYARTDLAISRAFGESLSATLAIDNAFGEDYETAIGFPVDDATWRFALSHGF